MGITDVVCTKCSAVSRSSKPIPAGTRVKCPKCAAIIVVAEAKTPVTAKPAAPPPKTVAPRTPDEELRKRRPDDDEPTSATTLDAGDRPRHRDRDDPDEDDRPRRRERDENADEERPQSRKRGEDDEDTPPKKNKDKPKKKGVDKKSIIVGGVAVALLVGAILLIGYKLWGNPKEKNDDDDKNNDKTAQAPKVFQPPPGGGGFGPGDPVGTVPGGSPKIDPPPLPDLRPQLALVGPVEAGKAPTSVAGATIANDVLDRVKKATVYVRLTDAADETSSGSGFVCLERDLVVTNAHVVGMKQPNAKAPKKVELVFNSGEQGEFTCNGKVLGVDRAADLAVLRVEGAKLESLPPPLTVVHDAALRETHKVWAFGFPLGEGLGKNVTVSDSTVSSLRRDADGVLDVIQIGAGTTRGNSGGPIVDSAGNVVAVCVSGVAGTHINFTIPGAKVSSFLRGRFVKAAVDEPVVKGADLVVAVHFELLDPLSQIKEAALDWWIGDPGAAAVAASYDKPAPGNDQRQTQAARRTGATASVELTVPGELPSGKVLWLQPKLLNGSGETVYFRASSRELRAPPQARPANLVRRFRQGQESFEVESKTTVFMNPKETEAITATFLVTARMVEETQSVGADGAAKVRLGFSKFDMEAKQNNKSAPLPARLRPVSEHIKGVKIDQVVKTNGELQSDTVDSHSLPRGPDTIITHEFANQLRNSLDIAAIPLRGEVGPGDTWEASRRLPVGISSSSVSGNLAVKYTYRGIVKDKGLDLAVVSLQGTMTATGAESMAGRTAGIAHIDVATGRLVSLHAVTDVAMNLGIPFLDDDLRNLGAGLMATQRLEIRVKRQ